MYMLYFLILSALKGKKIIESEKIILNVIADHKKESLESRFHPCRIPEFMLSVPDISKSHDKNTAFFTYSDCVHVYQIPQDIHNIRYYVVHILKMLLDKKNIY